MQVGAYDMSDLKLLRVARARLRCVELADEDIGGVDKEEEAEGRGPVNVLVVVPEGPNQVAEEGLSRSASTHSENRRKRWCELNNILEKNKRIKTSGEYGKTTGYSYVTWSEVKSVLGYETYIQKRKSIPEDKLEFLYDYLAHASEAMNGYVGAPKEAKRHHFIAPVLIMFCSLFNVVKLEVEELVVGNDVHAHSFFEFMLTRGKAYALVGCEAVVDLEGVYVVYGIVTDFIKWHLHRSGENSILMDGCTLGVPSNTLSINSLRYVCEMIYGVLSDDEQESKEDKFTCDERLLAIGGVSEN